MIKANIRFSSTIFANYKTFFIKEKYYKNPIE